MLNKLLDEDYWDELDSIVERCLFYFKKLNEKKNLDPVDYAEEEEESTIYWLLHMCLTDFDEQDDLCKHHANYLIQTLPILAKKVKKSGFGTIKEEIKAEFYSISLRWLTSSGNITKKETDERLLENNLFSDYVDKTRNIQELIDILITYTFLNEEFINA